MTPFPIQTLVVLPNWLGDLVMSLPALAELRRNGALVAVGAPGFLELLVDAGLLDETVAYDRRGADASLAALWRVGRACARYRPDAAVVLAPNTRGAIVARLSGARRRRGYGGGVRPVLLNDVWREPIPPRSTHLSDQWLALAAERSLASSPTVASPRARPRLDPGPRAGRALDAVRSAHPNLPSRGEYVVLSPGATYGPTKRWPEESYAALAREIERRHGWPAVVVGTATERATARLVADAGGGSSLAGETDLLALAALLAESAGFVGNDSGPMHLAAAVGVPTVGVFGSTSPAWTAPRGRRAAHCGPHPVDCSPCFLRRCPIGLPCLRELTPPVVVEAFERALVAPDTTASASA